VTQRDIKEVFDYNPDTGVCTWKQYRLKAAPGEPIDERYVYNDGYIVISFKGKAQMLHRLIWVWVTGDWPKNQIDHLNGDKLDNRWENLRDVTQYQNLVNKGAYKKKSSEPAGVTKKGDKWNARLTVQGAQMDLGRFDSAEKAHNAYLQAKVLFHGQNPNS
jgi:hypothetical protein